MTIPNIRRYKFLSFICVLFSILAGCVTASASRQVMSAGTRINEYIFEVGAFSKLKVLDNVNVVYRCVLDSAGYVAYHGEEDFRDSFIFTNNNGCLTVQVTTEDVNKPDLPTIFVYSEFLTQAENSSQFTLTIENPVPGPEFFVRQEGNGTILVENVRSTKVKGSIATGMGTVVIGGECQDAEFIMVGTGIIQADRLKAENVECRIMGSGSIGCWAEQTLKTKGIGSTKIYYKGDPRVTKRGGGKLIPIQTE